MNTAEILQLVLRFDLTQHVDDCKDPDKRGQCKAIEGRFTGLVDTLRTHCPSATIRELARQLWDTVASNKVRTAVFDAIATLHFTVYREPGGRDVGVILIPPDWLSQLRTNPIFCVGGVVFTGAQAVTWAQQRSRVVDGAALHRRARAFEAEYLLMIRRTEPQHPFNDYQREVLAEYPRGLRANEKSKA